MASCALMMDIMDAVRQELHPVAGTVAPTSRARRHSRANIIVCYVWERTRYFRGGSADGDRTAWAAGYTTVRGRDVGQGPRLAAMPGWCGGRRDTMCCPKAQSARCYPQAVGYNVYPRACTNSIGADNLPPRGRQCAIPNPLRRNLLSYPMY